MEALRGCIISVKCNVASLTPEIIYQNRLLIAKMNKSLKIKKPKHLKLFPFRKRLGTRLFRKRMMQARLKKNKLKQLILQITKGVMDLPQRWIQHPNYNKLQEPPSLKLLSYNILAECNILPDMYPGSTIEDLAWQHREGRVIKNILDVNPDIACLQEFQPAVSDTLVHALKYQSYEFVSKIKTGKKREGEATFWKKDKYELLHNFYTEMNVSSHIKELDFMNRDTIALITVLKNLQKEETLIVCNTHLLFNMKRGEIKLGHILLMLRSIEKVRELCQSEGYNNINTFICGDFNTIPNSLIYNMMSESLVNLDNVPLTNYSNQLYASILNNYKTEDWYHYMQTTKKYHNTGDFNKNVTINSSHLNGLKNTSVDIEDDGKISISRSGQATELGKYLAKKHKGRNFESAYAHVYKDSYLNHKLDTNSLVSVMINKIKHNHKGFDLKNLSFEGGVTHMTNHMWLNVDYIWCDTENKLKPHRILETIDYHKIASMKKFPNNLYPSDHVPISAEFS